MEAYEFDFSPVVARTMLRGHGLPHADGMFLSNRMFWTMMRRAMSLDRPSPLINVQPKLGNRNNNHVSVEIYPSEPDPPHISVDIFPFELPRASRNSRSTSKTSKKSRPARAARKAADSRVQKRRQTRSGRNHRERSSSCYGGLPLAAATVFHAKNKHARKVASGAVAETSHVESRELYN